MTTFEIVAERQASPEGPTLGPNGWVLSVCSFDPQDRRWACRGGDITATHPTRRGSSHRLLGTSTTGVTGIPAALAFGPDGALYIADEGRRAILRATADGALAPFLCEWACGPLNGPNDLVFDRSGDLYFTDPWGSSLDRPIGQVFHYSWSQRRLTRIAAGLAFPNGVALLGNRLFVAETLTNRIWRFELDGPGLVGNRELFCECPEAPGRALVGPDGLCIDEDGHVLVAHIGTGAVLVYDQSGRELDRYETGGPKVTNLCFGGAGYRDLFVAQEDLAAVIRLRPAVAGRPLEFCPSVVEDHPWRTRLPGESDQIA